MGLSTIIDGITAGQSLVSSFNEAIKLMGIAAIVLILVVGLLFFLPIIIASMRQIKLRVPVCIANVLIILTLFMKFYIPVILWLTIMLIAVCNKQEKPKGFEIPTINIIKYESEDK